MTKNNFRTARYTLIISGFALYALSMFLPALHTKVWEAYQTVSGFECLFWGCIIGAAALVELQLPMAFLCLLSNISMGVSFIFALARKRRPFLRWLMFFEAFVIFLAPGFPELFDLKGTIFLPGYYAWLASFGLIASGMSLEDRKVVKESGRKRVRYLNSRAQ